MGLATAALAASPSVGSALPKMQGSPAVLIAESSLPNSGKVSEVIQAGSYTYLHAVNDGNGTWLAIPHRDIQVGAEIRYAQGTVMKDFHSPSMNRTFDEVLFLGGVEVDGESAAALPPGHAPVTALPPGHAPVGALPPGQASVHGAPAAPPDLPNVGDVSEAFPAGSYTYLRITENGKDTWVAIPRRDIPVGARVRYADAPPMKDFHSPSMDRNFEEILFLGDVQLVDK